jgi:hypothetical protein
MKDFCPFASLARISLGHREDPEKLSKLTSLSFAMMGTLMNFHGINGFTRPQGEVAQTLI